MSQDVAGAPPTDRRNADRNLNISSRNINMHSNGNGVVVTSSLSSPPPPPPPVIVNRLRLSPDSDHTPSSYDDLQLEFSPLLYSCLEKYLPPALVNATRNAKIHYIQGILLRYFPDGERTRALKHREYRLKIMSNYKPLYRELYSFDPTNFFVPSFTEALQVKSVENFRRIMTEPSPGIFAFRMLHPDFCQKLMAEVENFERWVHETRFRIMRPSTMNKFGVVLDDFGMETMLAKMVKEFICPISEVFFPEIGGSSLDTHHGFVVEYGEDRDVDLGFHVDDSEVTLNVCLGSQFSGGELFFRGVRCEKHVNTESHPQEVLDYTHVPGFAVLHRGCHRHGARATTSGHRMNLLLWCRSSSFRELRKYKKDFANLCPDCKSEKKERRRRSIAATKSELLKRSEAAA